MFEEISKRGPKSVGNDVRRRFFFKKKILSVYQKNNKQQKTNK